MKTEIRIIDDIDKNNKFIIEGMTPLEELEERFGISFGEVPVETLNGYLVSKMEHIPGEKERFSTTVGDYNFKVIEVENKMVKRVVVTYTPSEMNKKDTIHKEDMKSN